MCFIDFGFNLGNYLSTGENFSVDSFFLILGTNNEESADYFDFYWTLGKKMAFGAIMASICFLFFWRKLQTVMSKRVGGVLGCILGVLLVVSLPCVARHKTILASIFPVKEVYFLHMYEPCSDLRAYSHRLELKETASAHPDKVVVIIGESFARYHSSLYGYDKETNPELSRLHEDGNLLVFNNCRSSEIKTSPAFKKILSSYGVDPSQKWYEAVTFADFLSPYYNLMWISNQSSRGAYDNVQALYAQLCDSVWFSETTSSRSRNYDEIVLPVIKSVSSSTAPSVYIINLMGQHEAFSERYPAEWGKFAMSDYLDFPEQQRRKLADYDNATLYNDYVVAELFKAFEQEDVLGFYFSDHGLDLYKTNADFCGHAKKTDDKSVEYGCQIPFFVYVSEKYKGSHPNEWRRMSLSVDRGLCTDAFLYSLVDILGWEFADNESLCANSFFAK